MTKLHQWLSHHTQSSTQHKTDKIISSQKYLHTTPTTTPHYMCHKTYHYSINHTSSYKSEMTGTMWTQTRNPSNQKQKQYLLDHRSEQWNKSLDDPNNITLWCVTRSAHFSKSLTHCVNNNEILSHNTKLQHPIWRNFYIYEWAYFHMCNSSGIWCEMNYSWHQALPFCNMNDLLWKYRCDGKFSHHLHPL